MRARVLIVLALFASCKEQPPQAEASATVQITSTPSGLKVVFDGKELDGVTPLELRSVRAFEAHDIEVKLEGQPSFKKRIAPPGGIKTVVHAELKVPEQPAPGAHAPGAPAPGAPAPDAPAPDAPAPGAPAPDAPAAAGPPAPAEGGAAGAAVAPPPPAEPAPAAPEGVAVAAAAPEGEATDAGPPKDPRKDTWPLQEFEIKSEVSTLWIPTAGGVLVKFVKPNKTYSVWTEGRASTRKGSSSGNVRYFLEGEKLYQYDAMGMLGPGPKTIRGARQMWIFDFDDDVSDNSGSLRIWFRESKLVPPVSVGWDPKKKEDVIIPDPAKLWTLDGLNPLRTYTFQPRSVELFMREQPWGFLEQMVCRLEGEGPARFEVFPTVQTAQTFSGAKRITCFFPDAAIEPNKGSVMGTFLNAPQ